LKRGVWSLLFERVRATSVSRAPPAKLLDARFSGGGGKGRCQTVVLLVDELDHLVTRKQTVLCAALDSPIAFL
jgi:Cdc6-like AAA superfamily ATPase